jgi:hypothetical protein
MHTMDNAKVIEVLEKQTMCNYFEKLVDADMHKVVLFSVFPFTAAANLSDPHAFVLVDDLTRFTALNAGHYTN